MVSNAQVFGKRRQLWICVTTSWFTILRLIPVAAVVGGAAGEGPGIEVGQAGSIAARVQGRATPSSSAGVVLLNLERLVGTIESRTWDVQDKRRRLDGHCRWGTAGVALVATTHIGHLGAFGEESESTESGLE